MPIGTPTGLAGNWWIVLQPGGYSIVQGTAAQVDAKYGVKNLRGPYLTSQDASAAAPSVALGQTGPQSPSIESQIGGAANSAANALKSLNPLAPLFQANIWLRVGEFALGVVLIGIGLARITGAENFISSAVKKVPL
jgi:hypothetical protein